MHLLLLLSIEFYREWKEGKEGGRERETLIDHHLHAPGIKSATQLCALYYARDQTHNLLVCLLKLYNHLAIPIRIMALLFN